MLQKYDLLVSYKRGGRKGEGGENETLAKEDDDDDDVVQKQAKRRTQDNEPIPYMPISPPTHCCCC